jgi:predicted P-loop ATPase
MRELAVQEIHASPDDAWMAELRRTSTGDLRSSFGNVVLLLSYDASYGTRLRRDEMRGVVSLDSDEVSDATVSGIRVDLEKRFAITPRDADTAKAIELVAGRNGFHPVRDSLSALVWDGERRLDSVAIKILRVEPDVEEESALVGLLVRRWFISLVARPFMPGCKVDTALILQGAQGVGKSTFFRELAREFFSDTEMALDKDAMMQLRGAWIYEWAELENVTRRQEVARVKAFLTSREDKYRPPFGRAPVSVKRSGVIVGTTNREDFLCDPSGSRRFWVIPVRGVDLERLRSCREQLLAEAVAAYRSGEPWWLSESEEVRRAELAARFADADPWDEDVLAYAERTDAVRTRDVLVDVLGVTLERIDRRADMRVANILRRHGFTPRQFRMDGRKGRFWCKPKP